MKEDFLHQYQVFDYALIQCSMRFIAIDFETATSELSSACELGLSISENGIIRETQSWLIRPPDNKYLYFNTRVHGISAKDTANAPNFSNIWDEVYPYLDGSHIFAHNAAFDIQVLRACIQYYKLPVPTFTYACSVIACRRMWPNLDGYNLKYLCQRFQIPLNHHRAGNDSEATARLLNRAFQEHQILNLEQLRRDFRLSFGKLSPSEFIPARAPKIKTERLPTEPDKNARLQPNHPLFGKELVFTGQFQRFTRNDAAQAVWNLGGRVVAQIGPNTDFVVMGQPKRNIPGKKERTAMELIQKGEKLQALTEEAFFQMLYRPHEPSHNSL